jgi:hypothetical protein
VNVSLLLAAGLVLLLGLAHSCLGERYILIRLFRRSDLPHLFGSDLFTRRTLRFAWHLTTVAWWGLAALLLVLSRPAVAPSRGALGLVVVATACASALITFVGSRGRHLAWLVFLAIAVFAWLGTR